jgi:hypothetical protein
MRRISHTRWTWMTGVLLVGVAACQPPISDEVQAQLATLDTVAAQRDSLFHEVADNARLLNELTAELDNVEGLRELDSASGESPLSARRDALRHKVQQVTARLADAEKRVASARTQLRRARQEVDTLQGRVAGLEQMVAGFEEMLASQRTTITALTERVTLLETENLALRDTLSDLAKRQNTAYYVVGTERELLERGIIVKEGGARVLFIFGKAGQTVRPARDLDPSQFTVINTREVTEIPLPDSTAKYVIASRQDLSYLEDPPGDDGRVRGSVRIEVPEQFWMPSRFLIVVRS